MKRFPTEDAICVIHIATTCDEHGVCVTKDSAEVIEVAWLLLDAKTLEELHRESVLVRPVNTPITEFCTSLTTLTWEHVRNAGSFRDFVHRFDAFAQEYLFSQNLDFSFATLDAWDMRVQIPREARDKAVALPPYLQHSRVYDLRTEYTRWQAHHPEALPFGPSSLPNICAALEVEMVRASQPPMHHPHPFYPHALATTPRRAMEECLTLTRVLRALIKKSEPSETHVDVLTRPLDARADVKAFLQERSNVLHMAGLAHDTTQSELESWFTQHGGRPIAFWTLRTPDHHKPTGTGFAVFSSHEEAAESLGMNGRALGDRAIEVSPSSSRVLDKAAEILTPFPPSKNRPRPGDWTCPSCGFSNFQRRTACFRCSFPAVTAAPADPLLGYGFAPPPPSMPGMPPSQALGHLAGHPLVMRAPPPSGSVPFRAGDWKCGAEGCGYHNFAKNVTCLRCGSSRVGASIIADPGLGPAGLMMPPLPGPHDGLHTPFGVPPPFAQLQQQHALAAAQHLGPGFPHGNHVGGPGGLRGPPLGGAGLPPQAHLHHHQQQLLNGNASFLAGNLGRLTLDEHDDQAGGAMNGNMSRHTPRPQADGM
ncbi:hypothetical protein SAICODRAFT_78427 [Saitoella complicata NRRL Y-17804]|uniref:Asparagine-rich protein n=1 Tax=Saitoella complicata (strain BCRC 22490 / CBS 7301 / JCM 7358 / NBRC 10748 / NRRL Y-17804) TaxID=698492 RepID=A0A0E9NRK6_SAICN|nr:uncharacterized protein SAICODRAFT_78427 [Saitoella complicata NRRL Y-17804]ODQ54173.1 hypothetical protein SAICODRAFT_78427 [Saitoella complicata NRRL Y-17804]GAO52321.1 hypothetical protein G7K_6400-t1 [Saitoella complicata NRRL Y-17804]